MTELQIIALILPVLLPVAVGQLIVRLKLFTAAQAEVPSRLFLYVCGPALIVGDLAKEQLSALIEPKFICATVALMLGLYLGLLLLHLLLLRRELATSAMAAFAASKFSVILGLPILLVTVRHHAIITMTINLVAGYFTILPLTLILINMGRCRCIDHKAIGGILLKATGKAFTHPLILTTVLGLTLAGLRVVLPDWFDSTLRVLGQGAIPLALLAVGMTLSWSCLQEHAGEILGMSCARMLVSPALALLVARLFDLPPVFAVALVVSFSQPSAKMTLPLAQQYDVYTKQTAGLVAVTTAAVAVVWPVVLWICEQTWPGVVGMR